MSLRPLVPLVAFALALPSVSFAQEKTDGAGVYKKAVPSVVWVHSKRSNGLATGSGSLVDKDKRLVLTNYHVVQDNPSATVFFPYFRDGHPVAEKEFYKDRAKRYGIAGRVIALDKKADLAVIQVEHVPEKTDALPLAAGSPEPGANVHSIGSAGKSDALFGYVKGSVRQVYKKDWKAELEPRKIARFEAKVIETDSPTNPGDSGGPLLNDKGELVGVTQGGAVNAQLVSTFIDVSEVRQLLNTSAVKGAKADKPAKKVRTTPTVSDGAKLFSDAAVKAANEALADLFKKELDVMIETHKSATSDEKKLDDLRKAKPTDRTAFVRDWTHERIRKADADLGILICDDPKSLYVDITPEMKGRLPADTVKKVVDALTDGLRAKKPDDALKAAVKVIQDAWKEKK